MVGGARRAREEREDAATASSPPLAGWVRCTRARLQAGTRQTPAAALPRLTHHELRLELIDLLRELLGLLRAQVLRRLLGHLRVRRGAGGD